MLTLSPSIDFNSYRYRLCYNSFFLVLAFRTYKELGTDNVELMKGAPEDDRE